MDEGGGFIKLHRSFLDWEWYSDNNTKALFLHLLLNAAYSVITWRGVELQPGQYAASIKEVARDLRLTEKEVRVAVSHLLKSNNVEVEGRTKYTIFSVQNWEKWQLQGRADGAQNGEQRASSLYNKEIKNINIIHYPAGTRVINNNIISLEMLSDEVAERFRAFLEMWSWNHNKGKAICEMQQEEMLRQLLLLPDNETRLRSLSAAIEGGWKRIQDIRSDLRENKPQARVKRFDPSDPSTWIKEN
jgi:hypothetical protein